MAADKINIVCNLCNKKETLTEFGGDHIDALREARKKGWSISTALGAQCPKCVASKPTVRVILQKKLDKLISKEAPTQSKRGKKKG